MFTREEYEKMEEKILAPYAMKNRLAGARKYPEQEHPFRSAFQRDRDRIIHSSAFRRLEYKTQVFVIHESDYYRTRLTHTIEVSQIACTIARILRLSEDLTEAIVLAHDLGHTPFGHSGEKILNELMKKYGGFEHNKQSLRVVDELEERYPEFPGLNLTWEVRESIAKHNTEYDVSSGKEFKPELGPLLEAQVANLADEIAYNSHDLDDGLASGLISLDDLEKVPIWQKNYMKINFCNLSFELKKYQVIRSIINMQTTDLIMQTEENIKKFNIKSLQDVRNTKKDIVCFSIEMEKDNKILKNFLMDKLYHHYRVKRMEEKAQRFITELFKIYLKRTDTLPPKIQEKLKTGKKQRVICDYIAGMTDHFALEEYKKLFDPFEKV
ncbi:MAG: deoxyguanosinetriphosphate triphosphohydrolase [Candidatus Firestonebacteria bacterium]